MTNIVPFPIEASSSVALARVRDRLLTVTLELELRHAQLAVMVTTHSLIAALATRVTEPANPPLDP